MQFGYVLMIVVHFLPQPLIYTLRCHVRLYHTGLEPVQAARSRCIDSHTCDEQGVQYQVLP